MRSAALTDIGLIRKINEDSYLCINLGELLEVSDKKEIQLYMVADGMGGANAGEIASAMAINEMLMYIKDNSDSLLADAPTEDSILNLIKNAIIHANDRIYKKSVLESSCYGMGTTLSMVLIVNDIIYVGHVGDSRVYLLRSNNISRLTDDHSLVAELVRNGTIKPEEANNHPQKNIITRALGTEYSVEADEGKFTVLDEDYLILCTDGLSNFVQDEELMGMVLEAPSLEQACKSLVECAKARGGHDNITVVIIQICKGGDINDR